MRLFTRYRALVCAVAAVGLTASSVPAEQATQSQQQNVQTTDPSEPSRMDRFEKRLGEMEARYQAELKARDEEIARLRSVIEQHDRQLKGTTPPPVPAKADTPVEKHDREHGHTHDESKATDHPKNIRADADHDDHDHHDARSVAERVVSDLNPRISVITDFLASISDSRRNDALNRVDLREAELDLRAAIHSKADGVLIVAFERDVENPIFPGDEAPEGPEDHAALEEGYVLLHDLGIEDLSAKIGRFRVRFGRQNMLHIHNLPTVDPPLVNQAFLSPEALADSGVSVTYRVPNPWGQHIDLIGEIISGEGAGSESPTLAGDLSVDSPAFNLHALWNLDLNEHWNFELGASWLRGHADADNARDVNLFGLDATLIHRDPKGRYNRLLQGELMYGVLDASADDTNYSLGAYVLAQQQLARDWHVGVRLDWTQDPNDDSSEAWGVSPYVSWNWTESLRFRLQYERLGGDARDEHILFMQATWIFGSHPPHPYWETH